MAIANTELVKSNGEKRTYTHKPKLNLDEREMRALRVLLDGGVVHVGWKRRILNKLNAVIEPDPDFTIDPS